jgi:murein DD-endopeptidase MepM/ murein hydrolase activator NlpD
MKKVISILSILCIGFLNLNAGLASSPDEKKPGDDKKAKAKREDTTKLVINQGIASNDGEEEESPDTLQILFPSHDLYASWDTISAHPYKFNEIFKDDSVCIQLTTGLDNGFVMPFRGPLTSLFGWRKYRPHYGTDINLETGDTVVSAFDGMVRVAKVYHGYGNCVIIRHNNGLETVYGHLSRILVESGQQISAGQVLGLGGNTGRSSGSHLHFEIRYLGQALDTQDFIDYEKGELKAPSFLLRKSDVENKYDLRALHNRHKHDVGMARGKNGAVSPGARSYRVKKGDTLGAIARRKGTTVQNLCRKNKIKPNTPLRVGQLIKI